MTHLAPHRLLANQMPSRIQMFLPLNTICAAFILGHDRGCVYSHPVLALNFCRSVKHTHTHSFLQLCISDDSAEMRFPFNQSSRMCVDFISMCVRLCCVTHTSLSYAELSHCWLEISTFKKLV